MFSAHASFCFANSFFVLFCSFVLLFKHEKTDVDDTEFPNEGEKEGEEEDEISSHSFLCVIETT